jgi:RNA polymerase sigma-70 factor (ECF subfamily)
MTRDMNEVCSLNPSLNRDGTAAKFIAVSALLSDTRSERLGKAGSGNVDREPGTHLITSDDQLLVRAQSGDQQAFVQLCRRHSPMVKKRIFSIVKNQEDTEDVLQDTLLRAYRHLNAFRRTCKFSSWLTTIGTNTALMMLRRRKIRREGQIGALNEDGVAWDTAEFADTSFDPEYLHSRNQIILLVRQEVEKLKPSLRSIIKQYYGTECSVEESAKALDISIGTAKSRLVRGRKTLRSYLRRHGVSNSRVNL